MNRDLGLMIAFFKQLIADRRGSSAVEYGIICAMIVLAMLVGLKAMGNENSKTWTTSANKINDAVSAANAG
jgi:pilus assembly protein Flp/PilA